MKKFSVFIFTIQILACSLVSVVFAGGPIDIGSRWELFVDHYLVEKMEDATLKLHQPERREVVFEGAKEWESNVMAYFTVLEDGGVVRMYYRASIVGEGDDKASIQALAESHDGGLTFTRPSLGLVEFNGSTDNNILRITTVPTVPPPFIDKNPDCPPEQRYKGLSGHWGTCYPMASPDGIHWKKMSEEPLEMEGTFDTVNTSFWDTQTKTYRAFTRYFEGYTPDMEEVDLLGADNTHIRAIQSSTSEDFVNWTPVVHNKYPDNHPFQMYTNATLPCPGAEHIYLAFPNRYVQHRIVDPEHKHPGINDAMFMSSRDCVHWNRFPEAWVRPGLDPLNWTERNNYPAWGIIETSDTEWSMYISEHYRHSGTPSRLRRLSIRPMGFVSVHAGFDGGELLTKPFTFDGSRLLINFSTSAVGSVRIEVLDESGQPVPGFSMDDMDPLFGDVLDHEVDWGGNADLSALSGKTVRLRIQLLDADLYAIRFK